MKLQRWLTIAAVAVAVASRADAEPTATTLPPTNRTERLDSLPPGSTNSIIVVPVQSVPVPVRESLAVPVVVTTNRTERSHLPPVDVSGLAKLAEGADAVTKETIDRVVAAIAGGYPATARRMLMELKTTTHFTPEQLEEINGVLRQLQGRE